MADLFNDFLNVLQDKIKVARLFPKYLTYNTMSNGIVNFTYKGCQIGRIYFGKKTSKMQIINSLNVIWIENKSFEEYIQNIDKWIAYAKHL